MMIYSKNGINKLRITGKNSLIPEGVMGENSIELSLKDI